LLNYPQHQNQTDKKEGKEERNLPIFVCTFFCNNNFIVIKYPTLYGFLFFRIKKKVKKKARKETGLYSKSMILINYFGKEEEKFD